MFSVMAVDPVTFEIIKDRIFTVVFDAAALLTIAVGVIPKASTAVFAVHVVGLNRFGFATHRPQIIA